MTSLPKVIFKTFQFSQVKSVVRWTRLCEAGMEFKVHPRSLDWRQNFNLSVRNLLQICSTRFKFPPKVEITPLVRGLARHQRAVADLYLTKGRIPQWRVTFARLPLKRGIDSTLKGNQFHLEYCLLAKVWGRRCLNILISKYRDRTFWNILRISRYPNIQILR